MMDHLLESHRDLAQRLLKKRSGYQHSSMDRQSLGGFIHILPVIAVTAVLVSIVRGWRIRWSTGIVQRVMEAGEGRREKNNERK